MNVSGFMLSASFAALTSAIAYYVTNLVPEPYMDEIFHIPQAQRYCQGKFLEVSNMLNKNLSISQLF